VSNDELGPELINSLKKVKHPYINLLVRVLEEIASEEKAKRRKTANPQKKIKQGISGALARQARSHLLIIMQCRINLNLHCIADKL
jgi:hypothetical protein